MSCVFCAAFEWFAESSHNNHQQALLRVLLASIDSFFLRQGLDKSPSTKERQLAAAHTYSYICSSLFSRFQQWMWYIYTLCTVVTHLYFKQRKENGCSTQELESKRCCSAHMNMDSCCYYWLTFIYQWVTALRDEMVVHKDGRNKLCTCLRRPLCKLNSVTPYVFTSQERTYQLACIKSGQGTQS